MVQKRKLRSNSFHGRILKVFLVFVFCLSLVYSSVFLYRSYKFSETELDNTGFLLAGTLGYSSEFSLYSQDPTFILPTANGIFESPQVLFLSVYTKSGAPIYRKRRANIERENLSEEIREHVLEGKNLKERGETVEGEELYDFYVPVFSSDVFNNSSQKEIIGVARVSLSRERVTKERMGLVVSGVVLNIFSFIILFLLTSKLAESVVKPLATLTAGVKKFGSHDLKHRIKIKTNDEIEDLAKTFNQMAMVLHKSNQELEKSKRLLENKVEERTKELNDLNKNLEKKVEERTKELRNRLEELEKFHKLTVGRELRMTELKKEIERLKKEKENL